jgi:signal peptidase I
MKEPRQKLSEAVKDLLSQGHTVELSAYGRSMIPFLRPGQKVQLAPVDISQVVRGDLVAFHKADYLVVHRVYAVLSANETIQLLTKGDSNLNPDAPVTSENYLAKVDGVHHLGAWRALSPTSLHSSLVLRLGKGYSVWFWVWKHFVGRFRLR